MFCPKCRYEYSQDVLICPDCNVNLVSNLKGEIRKDEEKKKKEKEKLKAKNFDTVRLIAVKSGLLMDMLKDRDIESLIEPSFYSARNLPGILVNKDKLEQAFEVLNDYNRLDRGGIMFCPDCNYEYEAGIEKCLECGTKLVKKNSDKPEKAEEINDKVVMDAMVLTRVDGQEEAGTLISMLEGMNIGCFAKNGYACLHNTENPDSQWTGTWVEIYVDKNKIKEAVGVLRDFSGSKDQEK